MGIRKGSLETYLSLSTVTVILMVRLSIFVTISGVAAWRGAPFLPTEHRP